MLILGEEEGLEYEVCINEICLEHVFKFKYLGYVLDESDEAECSRKVVSGKKDANAKSMQLECVRILHESLLEPVHMYGSETMIWRKKEGSRIRGVELDNLRGFWVLGE